MFPLVQSTTCNTPERNDIWMVCERFFESWWYFQFESTIKNSFGLKFKEKKIKGFVEKRRKVTILVLIVSQNCYQFQKNGIVYSSSLAVHSVVNLSQLNSTKHSPPTNTHIDAVKQHYSL